MGIMYFSSSYSSDNSGKDAAVTAQGFPWIADFVYDLELAWTQLGKWELCHFWCKHFSLGLLLCCCFSAIAHCNVPLSQDSDLPALSSSEIQNLWVVTGPPAQWGEVELWYRVVMRSPLLEIETSHREGPKYPDLDWPCLQQDSGPEISGGCVQPKMKLLSYPYSF